MKRLELELSSSRSEFHTLGTYCCNMPALSLQTSCQDPDTQQTCVLFYINDIFNRRLIAAECHILSQTHFSLHVRVTKNKVAKMQHGTHSSNELCNSMIEHEK